MHPRTEYIQKLTFGQLRGTLSLGLLNNVLYANVRELVVSYASHASLGVCDCTMTRCGSLSGDVRHLPCVTFHRGCN